MRYVRGLTKSHLVTIDVALPFGGANEPLNPLRTEAEVIGSAAVLKLPPPVWALIHVLVTLALSWQLGWPLLPGLPLPKIGVALSFIPWILPVWAAVIFRREET